ncbi:hypothetical protein, partial [Aeromonas salmonicida]
SEQLFSLFSLNMFIPPILNNAYYYFHNSLLAEKGWHDFFMNARFNEYRDILNEIEEKSKKYEGTLEDTLVCSCCGEESKYSIPDDAIKMRLFIENRWLYREVSIMFFDEYVSNFTDVIFKNIADFDKKNK